MYPILNVAIHSTKIAGKIIIKYYNNYCYKKRTKQENKIFVNKIENEVKKTITHTIHKFYPQHIVIDSKKIINVKNKIYWYINPINGKNNFIKNFPYFTISISVHINNKTEIAVIYEPICNELFTCMRGKGAQLNGYRIRTNITRNLHESSLSINLFLQKKKCFLNYINIITKLFLIKNITEFRCIGSPILELAYVAAGRIDGFIQINHNPRNCSGAILLIQESGGLVTDFDGKKNYLFSGNIIAGNPHIVQSILSIINKKYTNI
ncbi:MAG: inositol-phosphate phosphatase [Candidatus Westeberhardia cardiocondylae]|nr:inositol-phosphate phosphatase [Candidatus Westeberhardia cardiocondylae]